EILKGALDSPPNHQDQAAAQKQPDTNPVDHVSFLCGRQTFGDQKENSPGSSAGPTGPTHLQKIKYRVEPRPEGGVRTGTHESSEDRFTRRHRVTHELDVELWLQQRIGA